MQAKVAPVMIQKVVLMVLFKSSFLLKERITVKETNDLAWIVKAGLA
jgi:hypothetical protein